MNSRELHDPDLFTSLVNRALLGNPSDDELYNRATELYADATAHYRSAGILLESSGVHKHGADICKDAADDIAARCRKAT